jgi:hypothetical protein
MGVDRLAASMRVVEDHRGGFPAAAAHEVGPPLEAQKATPICA